ncbi:tight adherence protein B [Actinokineospora baliensis]|uniref:type II secretion system F family protein n=1 Tax=Actinokineospora baliensis TaxID=547056 RepID=UPI00195CA313|nr:type II secretion system protein [Actinokineospora baliensis]MBM7771401.1 tight adherence protein B [Actinokineospora baliensis]
MVLALLALAILAWPSMRATRRLRALKAASPKQWRLPRPAIGVLVLLSAAAWFALGPAGTAAAVLVGSALLRRRQASLRLRQRLAESEELSEALASLASELTTGAHPVTAAERTAQDLTPPTARSLQAIATATRLGGDIEINPPDLHRSWRLTTRYGIPLAATLTAVAHALSHQARFSKAVLAKLAGPQTSAAVLSALPLIGLALGEAIGAHPLTTLTSTPHGQLLLLLGATFTTAGLLWTTRIITRAVPT